MSTEKKKTLLFIVPNQKTGGTMSSLSAIYKELSDIYDFKVFALSRTKNADFPFEDKIIQPGNFFSAFHDNIIDIHGIRKVYVYFVKLLKIICRVFKIDLMSFLYTTYAKKIEKSIDLYRVIAFEESMPTYFGSFFKTPKIAWVHLNYDYYNAIIADELQFYNVYERIICVSEYTSKVFVKHFPSLEHKVDHIYNLLDVNRIIELSKVPIDDNRFIANGLTLVSAGRIDPIKRFSCIPEIASQIKKHIDRFRWYILGPIADETECKLLVENIERYNVNDVVFWLGGKKNPYNYFKSSSLYVCTSISEACPMVFNEAMVLGVPVVTTNFGSAFEFITGNENGIITDFEHISSVLVELLSDSDKMENMAYNIKNKPEFNENIIRKLTTLFD